MKYLIHGYWRDIPREYLANSIKKALFIYVAGAWRHALWNPHREGGGFSCYYPVKRWTKPYLFIKLRFIEYMGEGIWTIYRNKLGGRCEWFNREKKCFYEVKKALGREYEVIHLNSSKRFLGLGDILISQDDKPVCAVDVVASSYDKSLNRWFIQTAHKKKVEWIHEMREAGIYPFYAFLLNGDLVPKKYNYMFLTDEVVDRFFKTKKGTIKKAHIDFTKNNLWGTNKLPSTPLGWSKLDKDFMTITELRKFLKGGPV